MFLFLQSISDTCTKVELTAWTRRSSLSLWLLRMFELLTWAAAWPHHRGLKVSCVYTDSGSFCVDVRDDEDFFSRPFCELWMGLQTAVIEGYWAGLGGCQGLVWSFLLILAIPACTIFMVVLAFELDTTQYCLTVMLRKHACFPKVAGAAGFGHTKQRTRHEAKSWKQFRHRRRRRERNSRIWFRQGNAIRWDE